MRFKVPEIGDTRTKRKFLWFPIRADIIYNRFPWKSKQEIRWLEFANIREVYLGCDGWKVTEFIVE